VIPDEGELLDPEPTAKDPPGILEGTVGWSGSPEVTTLGKEAGDGVALIRVTLFSNHEPGKPVSDDGLANGREIEARLLGPIRRTPKRGERVIVAWPGNNWEAPGSAVILGVFGPDPSSRFGRKKTVMDFGDDDVVLTSTKSISLVVETTDEGASSPSRYVVSVSAKGGAQIIASGSGLFAKDGQVNIKAIDGDGNMKTAILLDQDELSLIDSTSDTNKANITMSGGDVTMLGSFMNIVPLSCLMLGQKASPATPILVGPSGVTGVPSAFIFAAVNP
jgi:hypothetical protein